MSIEGQGVRKSIGVRVAAAATPVGALFILLVGFQSVAQTSSLTIACVMIGVSMSLMVVGGTWFTSVSCMPRAVSWAMWATAGAACLGWTWQRMAYLLFIPDRFLTYGYFLSPPGSTARIYMMEAPLKMGVLLFVICFAWGTLTAWRAGSRWSIAVLAAWWFTAYLIYASASLNLWAQGDAAIFI